MSNDGEGKSSCCATHSKPAQASSCHTEKAAATSSCCAPAPTSHAQHEHGAGGCCDTDSRPRFDWILWGSLALVAVGYLAHATGLDARMPMWFHHYASGSFELMNAMWWGLAIGIVFVGLLGEVPRETVMKILGRGGTWNGLFRATAAGVLLDLCSHGILAVGMKLYERGASTGQVMAFLIASPWNSLSLTLILFGLIGVGWTLAFIALSLVIALVSGWVFEKLVAGGKLPANPFGEHVTDENAPSLWSLFGKARFSVNGSGRILMEGVRGSRMVIRWALFGVVIAGLIRAFVPEDIFADWFGPTVVGLMLTVLAATIIEVCSEGSVPIAADLMNRAAAPGNAFTFLMAGVATDYTEVMTLRDTTRSWKIALALPLVTLPQVIVIGLLLNQV